MKKKDEVHADDLLDQLKRHVEPPQIPPEKNKQESEEADSAPRPKTLEELFGHSFIRRGSSSNTRSVTKAKPIPPDRKQNLSSKIDPTKARIDETEYDLQAIFGIKEEEEGKTPPKPSPRKTAPAKPADPYDALTIQEKKSLAADYRKKLWRLRLDALLLVILAVFSLFWENADTLGFQLPDILNAARYPAVSGWIAIQMLVFGALLVPESFRRERNNAPIRLFSVMLIVHAVYIALRLLLVSKEPMVTFCLPVMVCGFLAKLCSFGAVKREYLAFCVAFSSKEKYTLRMLEGADADLERDALHDFVPEDTRYFAVERVRSVLGFKREINARGSVKRPARLLIPAAILAGVSLGMVWWSVSNSFSQSLTVSMGGFVLALPLSLLYIFYAPMTTLATGAHRTHAAVMGERTLDEYAPPSVVAFQDSEVFPPEQVQLVGVKVFGSADLSKVIGYASAIFCATGGALGEMFSLVVSDTGYTADMDFITVSDNGVEAAVDGELVMIGSRAFLREAGIRIPPDSRDLETDAAVMYMAISREAVARLEVSYELDEDFAGIARNLFQSGVCVAIKTFDPNINRAFLEKHIRWGGDMPLKIIRGREKKDRILRRESAESILLSGTKRGLFETVKFCRTTRHLMQIGTVLAVLSFLASIPLYWILLKMLGVEQVTSLNLLIYQLIWLLPMVVITKLFG